MASGRGRAMPYKQISSLELADDFALPTCDHCSEQFLDAATTRRLDAHLAERYARALRNSVAHSLDALRVHLTQQEIESLLGLSHGYVSKLRNGKKEPSPTLVAELMLLAAAPKKRIAELRTHWTAVGQLVTPRSAAHAKGRGAPPLRSKPA